VRRDEPQEIWRRVEYREKGELDNWHPVYDERDLVTTLVF